MFLNFLYLFYYRIEILHIMYSLYVLISIINRFPRLNEYVYQNFH